jgi:tRNA-dihydrouridine synthase
MLLHHFHLALEFKGTERGVLEMRKLYSSYLRDYPNAKQARYQLVRMTDPQIIEDFLQRILKEGLSA